MKVLALDFGTKCGWALSYDGNYLSGVWDLKPKSNEGPGMRGVRFLAALDGIGTVDAVYFEEVRRHHGTDAAHAWGGWASLLGVWCERNKIPVYGGIPVGTIKKHATGRGTSDKDAMVRAARKEFPSQCVKDDNQADALWILDYAVKTYYRGDWIPREAS